MASLKKSVMFSDATVKYIEARYRHSEDIGWSEALNESFNALKYITLSSLPDFSEEEWTTILNVYSGCAMSYKTFFPLRIASDMMDAAGAISLEELAEDYASVVKKVHAMSQVEQFAILDFVQKFWCNDWNDCEDFDEIKSKIIEM